MPVFNISTDLCNKYVLRQRHFSDMLFLTENMVWHGKCRKEGMV